MTPQQTGWETRRRRAKDQRKADQAAAVRVFAVGDADAPPNRIEIEIQGWNNRDSQPTGPRPSAWILIAAIVGVALTLIASHLPGGV